MGDQIAVQEYLTLTRSGRFWPCWSDLAIGKTAIRQLTITVIEQQASHSNFMLCSALPLFSASVYMHHARLAMTPLSQHQQISIHL